MPFRPEIWVNAFVQFYGATPAVFDRISRYDQFVGTATRGDTIHIPALTLPKAGTLVPGSVGSAGRVSPTDRSGTLVLDQFKGFPIPITTLDERYNHPDYVNAITVEAARQIKDAQTESILALAADATVTQEENADGGALLDSDILAIEKRFTEAKAPVEGRYLLVTPNAANDLKGIDTYINKDYGDGQGQRAVRYVRSFEVIEVATEHFTLDGSEANAYCMAFHSSAIAGANARPHFDLVKEAGEFQAILETGLPYGVKIIKADRIVRVPRAV